MSSPELHSNLPLPTQEYYQLQYSDYEDAVVDIQNRYNTSIGVPEVEWDAWNDVMATVMMSKRAALEGRINAEIPQRYRTLLQLGDALAVPQIENSYYRVQYAFANGFLQQQRIIEQMYGGELAFEDTFHPVAEVINSGQQYFETIEDMHAAIRAHVTRIGGVGLMAVGHARGFIEKWAQEVYTPATYQHQILQDIFKMGHGVAVYGAREAHLQAGEAFSALVESTETSQVSDVTDDSNTSDKE